MTGIIQIYPGVITAAAQVSLGLFATASCGHSFNVQSLAALVIISSRFCQAQQISFAV